MLGLQRDAKDMGEQKEDGSCCTVSAAVVMRLQQIKTRQFLFTTANSRNIIIVFLCH